MRRYPCLFLVAMVALVGCEGARNNTSWSDKKEDAEIVPSIQKAESADTTAADSGSAETTQPKH